MVYDGRNSISAHFEGPFALASILLNGRVISDGLSAGERRKRGTWVLAKGLVHDGSRIFRSKKELVSALVSANFFMSPESGMEIVDGLIGKRFNYIGGGNELGHLEFREDYQGNGKKQRRRVYVIEDHSEESYRRLLS